MMRSLFSGVSGLRSHQTRMDVIGNNIANVNTTGYKAKTMNFSDMLYQTTQAATGPNTANGTGGTNPRQIGLGVKTAAISTSITQEGSTQSTGNPFDIKISGEAFFVVSDGTNTYYTRDGAFDVDKAGNLVMSSTGYIVQGWGVDSDGQIVQGTVGNINVMAKNSYSAAATTQAAIKGIIDENDGELQNETGKQVNVPVYDSKGYEYSLKFGILPSMMQKDTTREIQNTANAYDLPTEIYQVDASELTFTYTDAQGKTKTLSSTSSPELIEALKQAVWTYHGDPTQNVNGSITGTHELGKKDSIDINIKDFIANTPDLAGKVLENGELNNATDFKVTFSGAVGYAKQKPNYPLAANFAVSTISDQAISIFYKADGADKTKFVLNDATNLATVTSIRQVYEDDNGDSVTDYVFKDSSANGGATITMPDGTEIPSSLYSDIQKILAMKTNSDDKYPVESYISQETKTGEVPDEGNYTLKLLGMTDINGEEVNIDQLLNNGTSSWSLVYNKSDGEFSYVGSDGNTSFELGLSVLGENFKNVTIDVSDTKNQDNGKKSSVEGFKTDGRKLGTMTGVSIGTDGRITANYSNGMSAILGQICVGTFPNAMGLENAGDNLYQVTANSGDVSIVDIKGSGTGTLTTGVLEMSNVDLSQQFTDMITTQRGFQANSRIITVSDTLLEELVNIKR